MAYWVNVDIEAKLKVLQDTAPFYGYSHECEKQHWLDEHADLIANKYKEKFLREPVTELLQS